jgi:hypothetical protein
MSRSKHYPMNLRPGDQIMVLMEVAQAASILSAGHDIAVACTVSGVGPQLYIRPAAISHVHSTKPSLGDWVECAGEEGKLVFVAVDCNEGLVRLRSSRTVQHQAFPLDLIQRIERPSNLKTAERVAFNEQ